MLNEVKRTEKEICEEIDKVTKARVNAQKKIVRCDKRTEELLKELKEAD